MRNTPTSFNIVAYLSIDIKEEEGTFFISENIGAVRLLYLSLVSGTDLLTISNDIATEVLWLGDWSEYFGVHSCVMVVMARKFLFSKIIKLYPTSVSFGSFPEMGFTPYTA